MVRTEVIEKISELTGVRKTDVEKVLSAFVDVVHETVALGEKVVLPRFGSFFIQKLKKKPIFGEDPGEGFWTTLKFHPSREKRWRNSAL